MIHVCKTKWGIGVYFYIDENGQQQSGYGFANPENPHDFSPDVECCTEEEISNWMVACKEWDEKEKQNG